MPCLLLPALFPPRRWWPSQILIDLEQFLETVTLNYSLDVFSELGASAQFAFVECSFAVVYSCTIVWRTLRK